MNKSAAAIVRQALAEEYPSVADLILTANPRHRSRVDNFVKRGARWHDATPVVCEIGGKLASCACVFRRAVWGKSGPAHFSGIGAVATRPEYRGRGLATRVLAHCAEVIQDRGDRLAILFCSIVEFYARLGWSCVTEDAVEFDVSQLQGSKDAALRISRVNPEAIPHALRQVSDAQSAIVRSDELWREYANWRREDDDLCLAAHRGDQAVAYSRGRRQDGPSAGIRVVDAASLPGFEHALLPVLAEQARSAGLGNTARFHALISRHHPLIAALEDAEVKLIWRSTSADSGIMMIKPIAGTPLASRYTLGFEDFRGSLPWGLRTWWGIDRF